MFSDEFLALSVEEQNKKIKSAGNADLSVLPEKVQELVKQGVDELLAENEPIGKPIVRDERTSVETVA